MSWETKTRLAELAQKVEACRSCPLGEQRTRSVFSSGNPESRILFVGEGPGKWEDRIGEAFVGDAGDHLNRLLEASGWSRQDIFIVNTVKCADRRTRVKLVDGTTMRIDQMVKARHTGPVLSLDSDGRLVPRKVVGWYRTPLGDRRLFRIHLVHSRRHPRGATGAILTEDHLVLTDRGWVPVKDVSPSDRVASGDPAPGPRGQQVILGTLLGDSGVYGSGLEVGHGASQDEWVRLQSRLLGLRYRAPHPARSQGKVYWRSTAGLRVTSYWRWLREQFYPRGNKVVARSLVEQITPLGLAAWFMDDGYLKLQVGRQPRAEFATNGFGKDDVEWLAALLCRMGFDAYPFHNKGWRIQVSTEGTKPLMLAIAPFVPPSLRYKLPPALRGSAFLGETYDPEPPKTFWDRADIQEVPPLRVRQGGRCYTDRAVYCLDVEETHNFATLGGVIHNCRATDSKGEDRTPGKKEIQACMPWLQETIYIVDPIVIVTLGKVPAATLGGFRSMTDAVREPFDITIQGRRYPLKYPAVALYHPSSLLRQGNSLDLFLETADQLRHVRRTVDRYQRLSRDLPTLPEGEAQSAPTPGCP